jgi:hypothetical protein
VAQTRKSGFHISYVTITYRSVLLGILGVVALAALVTYVAFPTVSDKWTRSAGNFLERVLEGIGLGVDPTHASDGKEAGPQQAHFTAIDGMVRVRKSGTQQMLDASYSLALEKGDMIQTGPEGIAKVAFPDGTSYSIKPDSLIVVQDNSVDSSQRTSVAVTLTTGTVDLVTPVMKTGSKSVVTLSGASLTVGSDTSAVAHNDPRTDEHDVTIRKGSAVINRDGQDEKIAENERAAFKQDQPGVTKTHEIGPPTLVDPPNMQSVFVANEGQDVVFSWSEVPNVKGYHIKVSKNPYFSSLLLTSPVQNTTVSMKGFAEGAYYWSVQSIGLNGKESVESERNKFQIVYKKGDDTADLMLDVDALTQYGRVIEVRGHTEPGAHVMVNGQSAVVNADGTFSHFTGKLDPGEGIITVTAQNNKGRVSTKTKKVVIQ